MKVSNLDKSPLLRMLVYGDSGSGKTTFLGTAMECKDTSPLLVLNARGQPISLRYLNPRPLVLDIESIADFNNVYNWLAKDQDMGWLRKHDGPLASIMTEYLAGRSPSRFKTVAVDSITHVQRFALDQIIPGTLPANPTAVPVQTKIQHWGRALALMTNFADRFFQLPLHVIMTALTRRDNIENLGLTLFAPFLWGQSNMEIPSHAEIVGRLMCTATVPVRQRREVEKAATTKQVAVPFNIMYLKGGRDFIAKWQGLRDVPFMMANPTIGKFIKRYEAGRGDS